MIDVVFLLIVFFMVVAQKLSEQYVELSPTGLGVASSAKVPESPPSRTIISVDESPLGQVIYWGEQEIDMSQITTVVARNPSWQVLLRYHNEVPYSVVDEVYKQVINGGQPKVVLASFKSAN